MTSTSKYSLYGSTYLDIGFASANASLLNEQLEFVGSATGNNEFFLRPAGYTFSFTDNGGGTGTDKIYLTGARSDYSVVIASGVATLTRTASGSTATGAAAETIRVSSTATSTQLIFSNGAIAASALQTGSVSEQALDSSVNSVTFTPGTSTGTVRVATELAGDNDVLGGRGLNFTVTGNAGVDKLFVPAGSKVDATKLGASKDVIYLQGNWSDYTKTVQGTTLTLSRSVANLNGSSTDTEEVKVTGGVGAANDRLVFADGAIDSGAALTKVKSKSNGTVSISELGTDWNADEKTDKLSFIGNTLALQSDTAAAGVTGSDPRLSDRVTSNGQINVAGFDAGLKHQYSTNGTDWIDFTSSNFALPGAKATLTTPTFAWTQGAAVNGDVLRFTVKVNGTSFDVNVPVSNATTGPTLNEIVQAFNNDSAFKAVAKASQDASQPKLVLTSNSDDPGTSAIEIVSVVNTTSHTGWSTGIVPQVGAVPGAGETYSDVHVREIDPYGNVASDDTLGQPITVDKYASPATETQSATLSGVRLGTTWGSADSGNTNGVFTISLGYESALKNKSTYTVQFWFYNYLDRPLGTAFNLFAMESFTGPKVHISINNANQLVASGGTNNAAFSGTDVGAVTSAMSRKGWHHFSLAVTNSTALALTVDGKSATVTAPTTIVNSGWGVGYAFNKSASGGMTSSANTLVRDFQVWKVARTASEVEIDKSNPAYTDTNLVIVNPLISGGGISAIGKGSITLGIEWGTSVMYKNTVNDAPGYSGLSSEYFGVNPVITGTGGDAGATVQLSFRSTSGGVEQTLGTARVQADGGWSFSATSALAVGTSYTVYARQTDLAGNVSDVGVSSQRSYIISADLVGNSTPSAPLKVMADIDFALTVDDFGFVDTAAPCRQFAYVRITQLPASGTLEFNGSEVRPNDLIRRSEIAACKLIFRGSGSSSEVLRFQTTDDVEIDANLPEYSLGFNVSVAQSVQISTWTRTNFQNYCIGANVDILWSLISSIDVSRFECFPSSFWQLKNSAGQYTLTQLLQGQMRYLSEAALREWTSSQVAALTTTQIGGMSNAQVQALNGAGLDPSYFLQTTREFYLVKDVLTGTQYRAISADAVSKFSGDLFHNLSVKNFQLLNVSKLTLHQVQWVDVTGIHLWNIFTSEQVGQLTQDALLDMMLLLSANQLVGLSLPQFGLLTDVQMALLDSSQFTPDMLDWRDSQQHSLNELTRTVASYGVEVLRGLDSQGHMFLSQVIAKYLTPTQISWLTDPEVKTINPITLTPTQLLAIDADGHMVASQVTLPDPGQPRYYAVDFMQPSSNDSLWGSAGPQYQDISQGGFNNCYAAAVIAELAVHGSSWLKDSIVANSDGTTSVRFFLDDGTATWIKESNLYPRRGIIYEELTYSHNYWGAAIEKAYLEYSYYYKTTCADGFLKKENSWGNYAFGGQSSTLLKCITGNDVQDIYPNRGVNIASLSDAFDSGAFMTFASSMSATDASGKNTLIPSHEFFVLDFDVGRHLVELANPWGPRDSTSVYTFWVDMSTLQSNASNYFSVCAPPGLLFP